MATKTLQKHIDKREALRAELDGLILERKIARVKKANEVMGNYDALESSSGKKRRSVSPEAKPEEDILSLYKRFKSVSLCRDLERNMSAAKSIIKQVKINVVGTLGKLRLNVNNPEAARAVEKWFNSSWAKVCDSRDDLHFSEFLQLLIAAVKREGDVLVAFDDFDLDDGKLIFWEADQLVTIDANDWKVQKDWTEEKIVPVSGKMKKTKVPLQQKDGIIFNSKGRVMAYAVTSKRGLQSAKLADVTILPKTSARIIKNVWRFNQLRGISDMITASADLEDIYEMRTKELQSAKLAASMAGAVTSADGMERALLRSGNDPEALLDESPTESTAVEKRNYENLESLTGGYMEYLEEGDKFEIFNFDRPNVNVQSFFDFVHSGAGASFGLAKAYANLCANSSYTAFRGDMLMTWASFYNDQKFLERHFCDWVSVKAIQWALEKKAIPGVFSLPDGWESQISWTWPKMPQIDPEKETRAKSAQIKDGFADYAEILGPNWREIFDAVAEQLDYARAHKLPFSHFETRAGAPLNQNNNNQGDNKDEQN
ncbi:MAG: hypothetical protein A2020_16420 [Lentisphaerae bacterium GWF2_45_14]|nr:MAG: hypothetical protein A2020_16420 [Lentisphaerae bacterium GWF2_45_14]